MANSISGTSADKFDLDPLWQNLDWYVPSLDALSILLALFMCSFNRLYGTLESVYDYVTTYRIMS